MMFTLTIICAYVALHAWEVQVRSIRTILSGLMRLLWLLLYPFDIVVGKNCLSLSDGFLHTLFAYQLSSAP